MERYIGALGLKPIEFDEISKGDIVGRMVGGMLHIGVAHSIVETGEVSEWVSHVGYVVADNMSDSVNYYVPLERIVVHELSQEVDFKDSKRRGRFPDDGTLVLTETVGEWEKGLIFHTGIAGWYRYDPELYETTEKVDTHLLRELFDEGKLVVTERF